MSFAFNSNSLSNAGSKLCWNFSGIFMAQMYGVYSDVVI
jgi:hypothetical protein